MEYYRSQVLICTGTGCSSSNSPAIIKRFEECIRNAGLENEIKVVRTGCFGLCENGPICIVYPEGAFYSHIKVDDVERIVSEHLVKGRVVADLLYKKSVTEDGKIRSLEEIDFYKKQKRVALRNCGVIDPENINEYIAFDGYKALAKALTEMSRDDVIDVILKSGLRGRGGAGFPAGKKWSQVAAQKETVRYVVCNGDEGDPGAFMDRSIMEGDPHRMIEGMLIAAYAVGAQEGYIYVRAEYPIAIHRLQIAIKQAREYGFLGDDIFGTGFAFDIELRLGSGAFVCGEETALIESMEGKRGMPRLKPPFPAQSGYLNEPSNINMSLIHI